MLNIFSSFLKQGADLLPSSKHDQRFVVLFCFVFRISLRTHQYKHIWCVLIHCHYHFILLKVSYLWPVGDYPLSLLSSPEVVLVTVNCTPVWQAVQGSHVHSCHKRKSSISARGPHLVLCKIVFRGHNPGAKGASCCWWLFFSLVSGQSSKMFCFKNMSLYRTSDLNSGLQDFLLISLVLHVWHLPLIKKKVKFIIINLSYPLLYTTVSK